MNILQIDEKQKHIDFIVCVNLRHLRSKNFLFTKTR